MKITLAVLALMVAVACQAQIRTVTVTATNQVLLYPTNFFDANWALRTNFHQIRVTNTISAREEFWLSGNAPVIYLQGTNSGVGQDIGSIFFRGSNSVPNRFTFVNVSGYVYDPNSVTPMSSLQVRAGDGVQPSALVLEIGPGTNTSSIPFSAPKFSIGTIPGWTGNVEVLVAGGKTNLFKFSGGLVTNVVTSYP